MLVAHFTENRDVRHVDEIVIDLYDVLDGGAGIGECELEILDRFVSLRTEFARQPVLFSRSRPSWPAMNISRLGPGRLDHVAVARRLGERFRI